MPKPLAGFGGRIGFWNVTTRPEDELFLEFVSVLFKADLVAGEIVANHFYKQPGKWCSWCDSLPVCLKDEKRIEEGW